MITIVVEQIRKRDGRIVPFQEEKIANAIKKAFQATEQQADVKALTEKVLDILSNDDNVTPDVERIQDIKAMNRKLFHVVKDRFGNAITKMTQKGLIVLLNEIMDDYTVQNQMAII